MDRWSGEVPTEEDRYRLHVERRLTRLEMEVLGLALLVLASSPFAGTLVLKVLGI